MSAAAIAVPKTTSRPKQFAIPDGPYLVLHPAVLKACDGDHGKATVLDALIFRSNAFGCFLQVSLTLLRVLTMKVATEKTLRKILGGLEELGYLTVGGEKGFGLEITLHREVIQAALDRAAVKPPGSATAATSVKIPGGTSVNLPTINQSSSTLIKKRTFPPTPLPQSAVSVVEPTPRAEPELPKAEQPLENLPIERQKAPEVPIPAPAEVPPKPEPAKKPYVIPIPPPRVHKSARQEFQFRFAERFGFELDIYQADLIETLVISKCVTMDEYLTRIWRDWAVGRDDKLLNPIGFSVWFAKNMRCRTTQMVIPFPVPSSPPEKERCPKCGGGGFVVWDQAGGRRGAQPDDQLCDCDMGRDLAKVRRKAGK